MKSGASISKNAGSSKPEECGNENETDSPHSDLFGKFLERKEVRGISPCRPHQLADAARDSPRGTRDGSQGKWLLWRPTVSKEGPKDLVPRFALAIQEVRVLDHAISS